MRWVITLCILLCAGCIFQTGESGTNADDGDVAAGDVAVESDGGESEPDMDKSECECDQPPTDAHEDGCINGECRWECDEGSSDLNGDLQDPVSDGCESECTPVSDTETLCDEKDDNCNGETDEGVTETYYPDEDNDEFGAEDPFEACAPPPGYVEVGGDCDDDNKDVNPDADEICNGMDDDCNADTEDTTLEPIVCPLEQGVCQGTAIECREGMREMYRNESCVRAYGDEYEDEVETLCGDGLDNDCDGFRDCEDADCIGNPNFACDQTIFVTSDAYSGDLGGLAGADAICEQEAQGTSLEPVGWKAVLSGSSEAVEARIEVAADVVNTSGGQIAEVTEFFSLSHRNPIDLTPSGTQLFEAEAWTGTDIEFIADQTCDNWQSTEGEGTTGDPTGFDDIWIFNGSASCAEPRRLYCINGQL